MGEDKVFKLNAQDRGVVRFGIKYRSKMHIGDNTTMYMQKHYQVMGKIGLVMLKWKKSNIEKKKLIIYQ